VMKGAHQDLVVELRPPPFGAWDDVVAVQM
jgi:hypothetical protein